MRLMPPPADASSSTIWDRVLALGQKQTFALQQVMSALPPKADIGAAQINVRFVPKAALRPLFDYFVGAADERVWDVDAEGLCRFQINDQLDFSCLLDR